MMASVEEQPSWTSTPWHVPMVSCCKFRRGADFPQKTSANPCCFWPLLFGATHAHAGELVGCDSWPGGSSCFSTIWGENKNLL